MIIDTEYAGKNTIEAIEVDKNLRMLFGTYKGSIALNRAYGIDISVLGLPLVSVEARLTAEIIIAAAKYEERANILDVSFGFDADGYINVKVVWQLVND